MAKRGGAAWLLATVIFSLLWIVATGLSLTGHQRCDCFGGWAASPTVAVVVDTFLLAMLWACRSATVGVVLRQFIRTLTSRSSSWFGTVTGVGLLLLGVSILCGEPSLYFSLQGNGPPPVRIVGGASAIGLVAPNSLQVAQVVVANQSAQPVQVVGGGVSCGCMTLNSIPLTIPPRQSVTLQVQIRVPTGAGPFNKSFAYFLRHPRQFRVVGALQGTVTDYGKLAERD